MLHGHLGRGNQWSGPRGRNDARGLRIPGARRPDSPGARQRYGCQRRPCRSRRCPARRPPDTPSRSSPFPPWLWGTHKQGWGGWGTQPPVSSGPECAPDPGPPDSSVPQAPGPPTLVRSRPRRRIPGCRIFTGRWSTPPGPHRCAREPNLESSIAGGGRARTSAPGLRAASRPARLPARRRTREGGLPGPRGAPTRRAVGRAGLRARARPPARHSARQSPAGTARTRRRPSLSHAPAAAPRGFGPRPRISLRGGGPNLAPPPFARAAASLPGWAGQTKGAANRLGLAGGSEAAEAHGAAGRGARASLLRAHTGAHARAAPALGAGPREPMGARVCKGHGA